jgi:hypothetical protein
MPDERRDEVAASPDHQINRQELARAIPRFHQATEMIQTVKIHPHMEEVIMHKSACDDAPNFPSEDLVERHVAVGVGAADVA